MASRSRVGMGALARRVVDEAAVVGPVGGARAGLDRRRRHALVDDALGHHHLAVGEVGRAACEAKRCTTLVPTSGNSSTSSAAAASGLDHGRQRLVVDHDEVGGVGTDGPVLGDHRHDRLADVAHGVDGHERPAHGLREGRDHVGREAELGRGRRR